MVVVWAEALKKGRENYPKARGENDPPTFDEAIASMRPEGPFLATLLLVKSVVESHKPDPKCFLPASNLDLLRSIYLICVYRLCLHFCTEQS
jgi:hypothetical protein